MSKITHQTDVPILKLIPRYVSSLLFFTQCTSRKQCLKPLIIFKKWLQERIFVKLERIYTPKCYVFVAKWDISGIVRYGSWKVNFILICVDRPKRPCTRFSPTTDWFFDFGDKKLSRILLNKEAGTYLSICHCFTLLIYEKLICK